MRIHYLQHAPFEGLGFIAQWARTKAHVLTATRFYEQSILPRFDEFDFLVVMGGPMSTNEERTYSWLAVEKRFIEQAIRQDKTVLGICLGAQLIADALGARVFRSRHKEIGWFPVKFTDAAHESPIFALLPRQLTVFHWHGDTFDLPRGAIRIAESEACLNQAFVYGPRVIGLQFHLELSQAGLKDLIRNCAAEDLTEGPYVQSPSEMLSDGDRFETGNAVLAKVLERICLSE